MVKGFLKDANQTHEDKKRGLSVHTDSPPERESMVFSLATGQLY